MAASIPLAHLILGLQTIVSHNVPPAEPAVMSIGHISAGSADAPNAIPSEVIIGGTARCDAPEVRALLKRSRRQMQMVFQDPYSTLNSRMTVGKFVAEPFRAILPEGESSTR